MSDHDEPVTSGTASGGPPVFLCPGTDGDLGDLPAILVAVVQGLDQVAGYPTDAVTIEGCQVEAGRLRVMPPTFDGDPWSWTVIAMGRGLPTSRLAEVTAIVGTVCAVGTGLVMSMVEIEDDPDRSVINIVGEGPLRTRTGRPWQPWAV